MSGKDKWQRQSSINEDITAGRIGQKTRRQKIVMLLRRWFVPGADLTSEATFLISQALYEYVPTYRGTAFQNESSQKIVDNTSLEISIFLEKQSQKHINHGTYRINADKDGHADL